MMLGKGAALAITEDDFASLADDLGVHPADLEAIAQVESKGFGWFPDGRMKILFEKHKFYKYMPENRRQEAVNRRLARKKFVSPKRGGYKDQQGAPERYALLGGAAAIDREAAFKSISMGTYQIMGFNYKTCGFDSAKHMFDEFVKSEGNQLRAFGAFLKENDLVRSIRDRDFERVESRYNGGGLNGVYAAKMRKASDKLHAGKWNGYRAGIRSPVAPSTTEIPKQTGKSKAVGVGGAVLVAIATAVAGWGEQIKAFFAGLFGG